jgi:hypothetical protein
VVHSCNPRERDQEDGSKPVHANSSEDPISKKPFIKKKKERNIRLVEWL